RRSRIGGSSSLRGTPTAKRSLRPQDRQRSEAPVERPCRRNAPPALEHRRVNAAKIYCVGGIAVAGEAFQRRLLAVEPAGDAASQRQLPTGRPVIGAAGQILLGPPAELGVGQHQRPIPPAELFERGLERDDAAGKLGEQSRLRRRLSAVSVETGEGNA